MTLCLNLFINQIQGFIIIIINLIYLFPFFIFLTKQKYIHRTAVFESDIENQEILEAPFYGPITNEWEKERRKTLEKERSTYLCK